MEERSRRQGNQFKNSFAVGADTAYDFPKLGVNMANPKNLRPLTVNLVNRILLSDLCRRKGNEIFYAQLTRLGYKVDDIEGYPRQY